MAAANLLATFREIFSSPTYTGRIPQSVRTDIANNKFGSGDYDFETLNAVYSEMTNLISRANNYGFRYSGIDFQRFSKGRLAVGDIIRDTYVDVADARAFPKIINTANDNGGVSTVDPFVINHPNIHVAYYFGSYSLQYLVTTRIWDVQKAFLSEDNMYEFVQIARGVLPESLQLDRWLIFQNMLGTPFNATPAQNTSIYAKNFDFEVGNEMTSDDVLNVVSKIRTVAKAMEWNTTAYNKLGVMADGMRGNSVLFINSGVYQLMKTVLQTVYHNELDFGVTDIIEIPDFGENAATSGQFAALLDSRGIYLYDVNSPNMWSIYNGAGEYTNTWLNYMGKIGYALHRNSCSFTLSQSA